MPTEKITVNEMTNEEIAKAMKHHETFYFLIGEEEVECYLREVNNKTLTCTIEYTETNLEDIRLELGIDDVWTFVEVEEKEDYSEKPYPENEWEKAHW